MKKLMFALLCVFVFGSANVAMAQDPVKTTTEQKEEKKEQKESENKETETKAEVSKEETQKAEDTKTEKAKESTPVEKKADEPAK